MRSRKRRCRHFCLVPLNDQRDVAVADLRGFGTVAVADLDGARRVVRAELLGLGRVVAADLGGAVDIVIAALVRGAAVPVPVLCWFLGRRDDGVNPGLGPAASEKRQGTKSREVGHVRCGEPYGDLSQALPLSVPLAVGQWRVQEPILEPSAIAG